MTEEALDSLLEEEIANIPERVQRGVAWLDRKDEDWRFKVKLSTLDMENYTTCICGQIFGSAEAYNMMSGRKGAIAVRRGFQIPATLRSWNQSALDARFVSAARTYARALTEVWTRAYLKVLHTKPYEAKTWSMFTAYKELHEN